MTNIEVSKGLKRFSATLLVLFVLLLSLVAPIDFTPLEDQPFYNRMMTRLDTFQLTKHASTQHTMVGWSQFTIVPDYSLPMAGYKPRGHFTEVHDSVYMKIMAINNGSVTAYLISADLLLFPPVLKDLILSGLPDDGKHFVYFSATHTHTSIGGWDPSLLGNILMGEYDEQWMKTLANETISHMELARSSALPAKIGYWEEDVSKYIGNRIDANAPADGKLRGIRVLRSDSTSSLFYSLGAHATLISKKLTLISADYPGEVARQLSHKYDFVQYMAGMVGSQRFEGYNTIHNFQLTAKVGELFASVVLNSTPTWMPEQLEIKTGRVNIEHGASQLRLLDDIKLRDWVFRAVSRPLQAEFTLLKIGNTLLIGTSCDFSGELAVVEGLETIANENNLKLIVTSFNGDYTGYITEDSHYCTNDDEEVMSLNWVGPFYGKYYAKSIKKIIDQAGE